MYLVAPPGQMLQTLNDFAPLIKQYVRLSRISSDLFSVTPPNVSCCTYSSVPVWFTVRYRVLVTGRRSVHAESISLLGTVV